MHIIEQEFLFCFIKWEVVHLTFHISLVGVLRMTIAQSAGAVEYPDCTSGYDIKQSDGEVPAVLELWGMRSTPSLPLLPGPLWPGLVAPDRALSMD